MTRGRKLFPEWSKVAVGHHRELRRSKTCTTHLYSRSAHLFSEKENELSHHSSITLYLCRYSRHVECASTPTSPPRALPYTRDRRRRLREVIKRLRAIQRGVFRSLARSALRVQRMGCLS